MLQRRILKVKHFLEKSRSRTQIRAFSLGGCTVTLWRSGSPGLRMNSRSHKRPTSPGGRAATSTSASMQASSEHARPSGGIGWCNSSTSALSSSGPTTGRCSRSEASRARSESRRSESRRLCQSVPLTHKRVIGQRKPRRLPTRRRAPDRWPLHLTIAGPSPQLAITGLDQ